MFAFTVKTHYGLVQFKCVTLTREKERLSVFNCVPTETEFIHIELLVGVSG